MSLEFTAERWNRVRQTHRRWWDGSLDRPIVPIILNGREPGRPAPRRWGQKLIASDVSVAPEELVDHGDYDLAQKEFLGDAFPQWACNFGPGVVAAFLGADLHVNQASHWFAPKRPLEIHELHLEFDPGNPWLVRMAAILQAAVDRWQGQVQIEMPDLGGTLDVLSTFRPGEKLLLDLHDHPEDVKRLTWDIHRAWFQCYEHLNRILRPVNPGYSSWCTIFSEEPYYMLQCDFSYMIGPDMFAEFVAPELAASCRRLRNSFYHLDGAGELPHVAHLLEIRELTGIQWVPGPRQRVSAEWPELHRQILAAGKRCQLCGHVPHLDHLVGELGDGKGIYLWPYTMPAEQRYLAEEYLRRYG